MSTHLFPCASGHQPRTRRRRWPGGLAWLLPLVLAGCGGLARTAPAPVDLVDPEATAETRALFANLQRLAPEHVLFGHQDDPAYGVGWTREGGRSDVRAVTGSYPAVFGFDVGGIEHGDAANLDGVRFDDMARWIEEAYRRGAVVTVSWHMDNPASGGTSWDTTAAVAAILPGGPKHALYQTWLDRFADFADGLRVGRLAWLGFGERVPVIVRPFHEMTGSWFWWGDGHATPEEYRRLWRFTVEYLRDERGLDHLLYAYSTDIVETEAEFLARYPGDAYVDVLGMDNYWDLTTDAGIPVLARRLRMLVEIAEARGKLPAFTEGGFEGIPDADWWTGRLLRALESDPVARRIAYVLVWRNAHDIEGHFYAPHPGHPSAADFVRFYEHPFVLFESELPDLYTWPASLEGVPPVDHPAAP